MFCVIDTPVARLRIDTEGGYITGIRRTADPLCSTVDPLLMQCVRQLNEYFSHDRTVFDLPIRLQGTPFQQRVWAELLRIPFGTAISYGELARRMGQPGAARAVGSANRANPLAIIVPCHRVIGANGSLTGYAGGLDMKLHLLALEGLLIPTA